MGKIRTALLLFITFCETIYAQTAGDYYNLYEQFISQEQYTEAFKAISNCNYQTDNSALSSAIIAIMYIKGLGVKQNLDDATIYMRLVADFEYYHSDSNKYKAKEQYNSYMKLPAEENKILEAFAFRWLASESMRAYDEDYKADEMEASLFDASGALEEALKADSINADSYSQYLLGRLFYEGRIGLRDKEKGLYYLKVAAANNSISALSYLGNILYEAGKSQDAMDYWTKAVKLEVKPLILPSKKNINYFSSPNIDIYDVQAMYENAAKKLKE